MAATAPSRPRAPKLTRRQRAETRILESALDVFSRYGFRGATLDQIAEGAGVSKPNLLYYFAGKEDIHQRLLSDLLSTWLDPLKALDPQGEPLEELLAYVARKIQLSRDFPRESRLFANEMLNGAPRIKTFLHDHLRPLVMDRADVIRGWAAEGRIAPVDPVQLLFTIWATTQHYADFAVQISIVTGDDDPTQGAAAHLTQMFTRMLTPA